MIEITNKLTDSELYALCKKWGAEALEARRKFVGLLPEVYKRHLYKRRNFQSIFHFAAALGGVSEQLVKDVLRLEKRFAAMPVLHAALVKGEIGLSKLARVASVVKLENESEICEKIRQLSRRAVDVLVKEIKSTEEMSLPEEGLFETKSLAKSLAGQRFDFELLSKLSPEVKAKLKELIDKEIDINKFLLESLALREAKLNQQKEKITNQHKQEQQNRDLIGFPTSRYIPVQIKRLLKVEFGNKCAIQICHKKAEQFHHEKPFAVRREHHPSNIKPLCRGHHELAHSRENSQRKTPVSVAAERVSPPHVSNMRI